MIVRRRDARDHRSRGHAVERIAERERLDVRFPFPARRERRREALTRGFQRNVVQKDGALAHGTTIRTVSPAERPLRSSGTAISASERINVKIRFDAPKTGVACSTPSALRASVHGM